MARCFLVLFLANGARAWAPEEELVALHGESFAAAEPWEKVKRELHRSIAASAPRPASAAAAAAGVAAVLAASPHALIVFQNALYVFDDHRDAKKHKPHYLFSTLLSILARAPLPDVVAAWDAGATGQRCEKLPAPCLAIAKQAGFAVISSFGMGNRRELHAMNAGFPVDAVPPAVFHAPADAFYHKAAVVLRKN